MAIKKQYEIKETVVYVDNKLLKFNPIKITKTEIIKIRYVFIDLKILYDKKNININSIDVIETFGYATNLKIVDKP